jgi:ribose-phosphate pyrophosphokinase
MSRPLIIPLPGNEAMAQSLAEILGAELGELESHAFPDGETYLRIMAAVEGRSIALVCTLADPDRRFLPLSFAARTARALGAVRVGLVAPYLCYMRQDKSFKPGEAVTSRHFADLVSGEFDWLVTVDPHLHRTKALSDIYTIAASALHAAPLLGEWIGRHVNLPYLIGPDEESRQWVAAMAGICSAPYCVLKKQRLGDRSVRIAPEGLKPLGSATPVLVDDVISSGKTMQEAIRIARSFSTRKPLAVAVHGLFAEGADVMLEREGATLITTNTLPHASNRIEVAALIAPAMAEMMKLS